MKKLCIIVTTLLLIAVVMTGAVSAEKSITIDVPDSAQINQVTTVPITIHDAEDILGFLIRIPNTISGTTVTVNGTTSLDRGSYTISSSADNSAQYVLWFTTTTGISGTQTLFLIDVFPTSSSPATIPLTVEVVEGMYDVTDAEVHTEYPVISSVLMVIGVDEETDVNPDDTQTSTPSDTPTTTPEQPPTETETHVPSETPAPERPPTVLKPSSSSGSSTILLAQPTQTPAETEIPVPTDTPTSTPGQNGDGTKGADKSTTQLGTQDLIGDLFIGDLVDRNVDSPGFSVILLIVSIAIVALTCEVRRK